MDTNFKLLPFSQDNNNLKRKIHKVNNDNIIIYFKVILLYSFFLRTAHRLQIKFFWDEVVASLHSFFPKQFFHLMFRFAKDPGNDMFHVTTAELDGDDSKWTVLNWFNS